MSESSSIFRRLASLALPVMGLNVLSVLSLAVDTAMCGRLPDSEAALAGLGFASQLVFLLAVTVMGMTVGTIALVARAHGARQHERASSVFAQSSIIVGLAGLGVAVVGPLLLVGPLLSALGADGAELEAARAYLDTLLWGSPFYYLTILYGGTMRAVGNTRVAFFGALVANGLNVVLNYGLILGHWGMPALGVRGAAIGTMISQAVNLAILAGVIRSGRIDGLTLGRPARWFDGPLVRDLLRLGWPAAVDMIILNGSFLSIIGMLGRIDADAVAAHGIGLRLQALAFVPGLGVSQAAAALIGQALGAGDVERARRVLWSAVALCGAIMSSLGLMILIGAHPIVGLFDVETGSAIEAFAIQWIWVLGVSMPIFSVSIAFQAIFSGSGATLASLRINLVTTLAIQIPASALMAFPLGLSAIGAWAGFSVGGLFKLGMFVAAYRMGRWAVVGVRR